MRGTNLVEAHLVKTQLQRHNERLRKVKPVISHAADEAKWHKFKAAKRRHRRRQRHGRLALYACHACSLHMETY